MCNDILRFMDTAEYVDYPLFVDFVRGQVEFLGIDCEDKITKLDTSLLCEKWFEFTKNIWNLKIPSTAKYCDKIGLYISMTGHMIRCKKCVIKTNQHNTFLHSYFYFILLILFFFSCQNKPDFDCCFPVRIKVLVYGRKPGSTENEKFWELFFSFLTPVLLFK